MFHTLPSSESTYKSLCADVIKLLNEIDDKYYLTAEPFRVILFRADLTAVKTVYETRCHQDMYYFLTGMYKQTNKHN